MTDRVRVTLTDGPLPAAAPPTTADAGAVWAFEGVVRLLEEGRPLVALDYEAYEPMTTRELTRLAESIADDFELLSIHVEHSIGRVRPGERSFRLVVASAHRAAGCRAAAEFIDAMKRSTPLWKNPIYRAPF